MPLSKSVIPVTFKQGLNQKTPDKLSAPGEFLALENCIRRKTTAVQKRNGWRSLGKSVIGDGTIAAGAYITQFEDDVVMLDGHKLYGYSEANDAWISRGSCTTTDMRTDSLIRNQAIQAMPDVAYGGGLMCVVYLDSRGGVRYSVFDDSSGTAIVNDAVLAASGLRPKIIAVGNGFLLGYLTDNGTHFTINIQPLAWTTPTTLNTALRQTLTINALNLPWDMQPYGSASAVFVFNNLTSTHSIGYMDVNGRLGDGITLPAIRVASAGGTPENCLTVVVDAISAKFWVLFNGSDGVDRAYLYPADLLSSDNITVAVAASFNCTGIVRAADNKIVVWYEHGAAAARDHLITTASIGLDSGTLLVETGPSIFLTSVGLWSKAYEANGRQYVTITHDNTLQPTYFTARDDGLIVAKALASYGGGLTRDASRTIVSGLCSVVVDSSSRFTTVVQNRIRVEITDGGTITTANIGLTRASIAFDQAPFGVSLGRNFHFAGGIVQAYDGAAVAELGFNLYPEGPNTGTGALTFTSVAASTSLTTAQAFSFQAIYEWTDGKGQLHRSAPSILVTASVTTNGDKLSVKVPTLRLTAKPSTSVNIVLFVALTNPTVLYRYATTANDLALDQVVMDITTAPVTTQEILYTTGGVLENAGAPPASCMVAHKQRLFLAGTDDDKIWFSKYAQFGEGASVQDVVPIIIESDGGSVRALASMDERLIIFKRDHIYFISGEGPLDTGQQNDYLTPIKIAHDCGTVVPQSVVVTSSGVMFKSDKGIYMLTRSFQLQYVGAGVDDFNTETVTSAVLLPDTDEVRFTTASGPALIYNYFFGQWSTFTNYAAVAAVNALGTYLHLTADGTVNREVPGVFDDNGLRIAMGIETGWFAFAGIQGFQRIYKALLLGDFINHHFCRIRVAYDYEDAYNDTIYFDTRDGNDPSSVYGEGDTYGAVTPYGGNGSSVFQCRVIPKRMKCQSIKLRIEDVDTIGEVGGGCFALVALTFEVGRKAGAYKLGANKTVG